MQVDRGVYSCEIMLTLLAFKALYPESVILHRGNHEARDMNVCDGFEWECLEKYDPSVFDLFSDVFAALPLASVVENRVFVVHGGLADRLFTIEELQAENRFFAIPPQDSLMLQVCHHLFPWPPQTGSDPLPSLLLSPSLSLSSHPGNVVLQILWSDPADNVRALEGTDTVPSMRGAGVNFGETHAEKWMQLNGMAFIIRSHECEPDGWNMWFGQSLLTIFSASNYCGDTGNLGAYVTFEETEELIPRVTTYTASPAVKTYTARSAQLEGNVLAKLLYRIARERHRLREHWDRIWEESQEKREKRQEEEKQRNDEGVSYVCWSRMPCSPLLVSPVHRCCCFHGRFFVSRCTEVRYISRVQWSVGLMEVLDLDVPFLMLGKHLGLTAENCRPTATPRIDYRAFLQQYEPRIMERSSEHQDDSSSGQLHVLLLSHVCVFWPGSDDVSVPSLVIRGSLRLLDADGKRLMQELAELLYTKRFELESLFRHFDTDKNGSVTAEEFTQGLQSLMKLLKRPVSGEEAEALVRELDADGSGTIEYLEFFQAFSTAAFESLRRDRRTTLGTGSSGLSGNPGVVRRRTLSQEAKVGEERGQQRFHPVPVK